MAVSVARWINVVNTFIVFFSLLIYAAASPHTDLFQLAILATAALGSTINALPDDGVTAPKHVGAVLMLILM